MSSLIYFALIGIATGWLGGRIMKGSGFGLIGNLVVGVVGAMLGGWALGALGIYTSGLIGSIISATVGAVLLLFIVSLIKK